MRHRFHSICPYFAMFPEAFAEKWIADLTSEDQLVLDPFSGRGTAPFQALLMGRQAVGFDINPVAYVLTKAKVRSPPYVQLVRRIDELESAFKGSLTAVVPAESDFFKLVFHAMTYQQICYVRKELKWRESDLDNMLAAVVLGSLHGDSVKSKSYLSNQMPRTISTKPEYSVRFWRDRALEPPERDLFEVLRRMIAFRYFSGRPRRKGRVSLGDMRNIPYVYRQPFADLLITSPPYLDTTSFEEDQWLRSWFLGGPDRPTRGKVSRDDRIYTRDGYWNMIADLWRVAGASVKSGGHVVVRIAGKGLSNDDLVAGLSGTSVCTGRAVKLMSSSVSEIGRRQTDSFRPGSRGLRTEVDCHFRFCD